MLYKFMKIEFVRLEAWVNQLWRSLWDSTDIKNTPNQKWDPEVQAMI